MKAIVAMTRDRVIGWQGGMPWRLPEDFRWFRQATMGHVLLMGRKTYASIGRPLPGRRNLVVTRGPAIETPGIETIGDLSLFREEDYAPQDVWVAGGAELYKQLLPRCQELYVSLVLGHYEGDTFFPPFEQSFDDGEVILEKPEFVVRKYARKPRG